MKWETVIGLEVHVELSTKSKIFCSCTVEFGGAPNTHCCPICAGMPGTLPVLNKKVVEYAMKAGLALDCEITRDLKFDRKNYFYPDLPKAYQNSQLYLPICRNGKLPIETSLGKKEIRIHQIHMEEDAGKLIHDPWIDATKTDYNRCGVPLIEIVSEPDFRSGEEVLVYLEKLRFVLMYLDVSDCKMQEGSMRADINLSIRPFGSNELGTRTEMKNMNSFKAIGRAIEYETRRQIEILEEGGKIVQETRRWDENKDATFGMRSKENAQDYRYFPEPDLPPVHISEEWYECVKASLPEMAGEKTARYVSDYGLPEYDAKMITSEKALAVFFEETVALGSAPKEVSNWIMGDLMRILKDRELEVRGMPMTPGKLSRIISHVDAGKLNRAKAREVFEALFDTEEDVDAYITAHDLIQVSDEGTIRKSVAAVLNEHQGTVEEYRSGKDKVFGFLVGQTMKAMKGKADPALINKILRELLNS